MFIDKLYQGYLGLCLFFLEALCKVGQPCNSTNLAIDPCPEPEVCDEANTCMCALSYIAVEGTCVSPSTSKYSSLVDNEGDGSLAAGILIPLCLIAFVICSIYVTKRFELIKWLRDRFSNRNRNYDEFMIGQEDDDDDPPLA